MGQTPELGKITGPATPSSRQGNQALGVSYFTSMEGNQPQRGGPYFTDRLVLHGSVRLREGPEQLRCGPPQERQEAKPCPTQGRRHGRWTEYGGSGQSRPLQGLGSISLGQNLRKTRCRRVWFLGMKSDSQSLTTLRFPHLNRGGGHLASLVKVQGEDLGEAGGVAVHDGGAIPKGFQEGGQSLPLVHCRRQAPGLSEGPGTARPQSRPQRPRQNGRPSP